MDRFELIQSRGHLYISKTTKIVVLSNTESWVTWCWSRDGEEDRSEIFQSQVKYEMVDGFPRPYITNEVQGSGKAYYLNGFTWTT